uniref:Uncharacterized protein n=1 Tax=Myoviridae sp. ctshb19 TaxID=2825194 RepID=A0A8S5UGG1_9CAUD|nr:MAG TPA: hypothetical protein [Myoviridae sp. ctshb19]
MQQQVTRPTIHPERKPSVAEKSASHVAGSRLGTGAVKQPVAKGNALGEMDRLFGMWGSL